MACTLINGAMDMEGEIDEDGARTYKVVWQIESDNGLDGPANVLQTPGLPVPGTMWNYLNDIDIWAWCRPNATVRRHRGDNSQDPIRLWELEQTFSTKRPSREQGQRQQPPNQRTEDPIFLPPKISGSTVEFQVEDPIDWRTGIRALTSAREPIRGPAVTFDDCRSQIVIEQNVLVLQLDLLEQMKATVNDSVLWGRPARHIKLKSWTWDWTYYGQSFRYFVRRLTFELYTRFDPTTFTYKSGWDRVIVDEGTLVLRGEWERNRNLATYRTYRVAPGLTAANAKAGDIVAYQDFHGNPSHVILDGNGRPWDALGVTTGTVGDDTMGTIDFQHYPESNFLLLGIPSVLT